MTSKIREIAGFFVCVFVHIITGVIGFYVTTTTISNGNRTECSAVEGEIGRVISIQKMKSPK